jgi:hypothetical protein
MRANLFPARLLVRGCFALGLVLQARQASAQEALRNSLAGEAAAEARHISPDALPYTFKNGDFRLLLSPSLDLDWNDNVYLSKNNPEDDYIIRPTVGIDASYPLTDKNLLRLDVTLGYAWYLNHHDLSTLYLASGSQLSFDIFVEDLLINLHDSFSYIQNSATEPAVSGTGDYGTFQNTAGLSGTWDLNDVTLTLGYDHQIVLATSSQFSTNINHAAELLVGRVGFNLHPGVTVGVEGTGTFTTYDQAALNNSTGWSGGVYGEWKPDAFLSVKPRFGYTVIYFQQTSPFIPASDQDAWYADLTISHQPTKYLTYSFSAGHELRLGIESDTVEDTYVRPSLTWNVIKNVSIGTSFNYENGTQGGGQLATTFGQNYSYFGAGLNVGYSPVKRLNVSLNYNLTIRSADVPTGEYAQNIVGLTFNYALQ